MKDSNVEMEIFTTRPDTIYGCTFMVLAPESELVDNSWLTVPANEEILFNLSYDERWQAAATILGVDLSQLTSQAGHA